jgi:hypothetical protein
MIKDPSKQSERAAAGGGYGVRAFQGREPRPGQPQRCDTPTVTTLRDLAQRLEAAAVAIVDLAPGIEAGEPWPLTAVYGPGPESEWGPREVLAHLGEMLPFWMGEIELVLAEAGRAGEGAEPPSFGRTEQDPLRIEVIGRDRMFPTRELIDRVDVDGARLARRLRSINDRQAIAVGRHVTRGELTVIEMAERFLVTHLEGHAEQLRAILATAR